MIVPISLWQLALAAGLLIINVVLSVVLKLGLARTLSIASVRMVVQLLLVGFVLDWVFSQRAPLPVIAIGLVMTALAGQAGVARTHARYAGIYWDSFVAVFSSAFLLTGISLTGIIQVRPWFEPQYAVPILGMILGNTLSGISLALDRFLGDVTARKGEIEGLLALGATRWEAAHPVFVTALRTGMLPIMNSMAVMGVVSLPGMMTGQILAGASPMTAVRYQIVIVFVLAASSALGAFIVSLLAFRRVFDSRDRLRAERVRSVAKRSRR